jgi:pimeloyl-ACP methyl ester carboxylesterase
MLEAYQAKPVFKNWTDGFLDAYIRAGTEQTGHGTIRLCCDPVWESKCFAVYPHDIWRYIPQLKKPVLVLYGAKSDTFLASAAKRLKSKVPQAAFRCFKNTGHFVPMERPDETAEGILDFLKNENVL